MEISNSLYSYIFNVKTLVAGQLMRLGTEYDRIHVNFEHDQVKKNSIITSLSNDKGKRYFLIDSTGYTLAFTSALVLYQKCQKAQLQIIVRKNFLQDIEQISYGLNWLKSGLIHEPVIIKSIEKALTALSSSTISRNKLIHIIDQIDKEVYQSSLKFNQVNNSRNHAAVH